MREKLPRIVVPYNVLRSLDLEVFHSALQEIMNRLRNLEGLIIVIGEYQDEEESLFISRSLGCEHIVSSWWNYEL